VFAPEETQLRVADCPAESDVGLIDREQVGLEPLVDVAMVVV
jgi:hypothetical protein